MCSNFTWAWSYFLMSIYKLPYLSCQVICVGTSTKRHITLQKFDLEQGSSRLPRVTNKNFKKVVNQPEKVHESTKGGSSGLYKQNTLKIMTHLWDNYHKMLVERAFFCPPHETTSQNEPLLIVIFMSVLITTEKGEDITSLRPKVWLHAVSSGKSFHFYCLRSNSLCV